MLWRRPLSALLAPLLGLLLTSGCSKDKPVPSPAPEKPKSAPSDKTPAGEGEKSSSEIPKEDRPAYTVTAIRITEEFLKNQAAAEKKYKDKIIEVEGTVSSARQNSVQHRGDVSLLGYKMTADDPLPLQVVCEVKKEQAGQVGLLGKGQKVRVKGKYASSSAGNITLIDAVYEPLTPSSVPSRTAEVIAKEFDNDKAAAAKKYGEKEVIVGGTIIELDDKGGRYGVKLAGDGKVVVTCNVEEDEFKTLKRGDKVRIKGEVLLFDGKELVITSAFLVGKGS